jgi:hypothetical protein
MLPGTRKQFQIALHDSLAIPGQAANPIERE